MMVKFWRSLAATHSRRISLNLPFEDLLTLSKKKKLVILFIIIVVIFGIMSEKEIEIVANSIRKNGKLVAKDKAKTKSFLKKIGILNKKKRQGNKCV